MMILLCISCKPLLFYFVHTKNVTLAQNPGRGVKTCCSHECLCGHNSVLLVLASFRTILCWFLAFCSVCTHMHTLDRSDGVGRALAAFWYYRR